MYPYTICTYIDHVQYVFLVSGKFISYLYTGVLGVVCRTLLDNLDRLPGDARTQVGIMTFDNTLHFYNLKVCTPIVRRCGAQSFSSSLFWQS